MINFKKLVILLALPVSCAVSLYAQETPTSGIVTVQLSEPIDFATARPLQAVRSTVVSSTNPAIPPGSFAVLQLQNRDGSYALKLLRIKTASAIFKTMSAAGTSVGGSPASGPHASLANGATVKFTLTQEDGSPGAPVQQAAAATSAPSVAAPARKMHKPAFVLEGIGIYMTKQQVEDGAKAHGATGGLHANSVGYLEIKTADLWFTSVQFDESGLVKSYTVDGLNPKHVRVGNFSGPLYDMAVSAFGQPVHDGGNSKWDFDKPGQPSAEYGYAKDDAPNGNLVVLGGN